MLEIVYVENSEQFFMRKQWTVLINVEYKFYECSKQFEYTVNMMCREQILLM